MCAKCPSEAVSIVRMIMIILVLTLIVVILLRFTFVGMKEKSGLGSVYLRVLINHIHIVLLTAAFNFEWPTSLRDFFEFSRPIT